MISIFSVLCHSAVATTSTQVTPAETARCSWLPKLIKHTNDPAVVEAGRKLCKDASRFVQYQFTPMHQAALMENGELLTSLHDIGQDIDQPDVVGFTPLQIMAMNGHIAGVPCYWAGEPTPNIAMLWAAPTLTSCG